MNNLFKRLKDKENKILLTNFGYLSILQVAGFLFPLITLPYIARVLGIDIFGKIAFASAIIIWFQTISDWGFNFTATRDISINRNDKDKLSEIFSNVFWSKCILMIFSLLLLIIFVYFIPKLNDNWKIILITFLIIPGQIMFPDWFFQGIEKMKYISILNLLSKIIFTIAVFVFIKEESDYLLQPLFISLGYIFTGVISMYIILYKWRVKLQSPDYFKISRTIKLSTNVFVNNFVPNLYNSFSTILLGYYWGSFANGILEAANKFVALNHQLMNVVARTFFPFLSRKLDKHDIYVKLNLFLSLSISIFLFFLSPFLIKLFFTSDFYEAINVLRILSFSIFLIAIRNVYGTHYLILKGYDKELRNFTFLGSFIGFLLAFPLIYFFSYIGLSINIIIAQSIMAFFVIKKAKKIKNKL